MKSKMSKLKVEFKEGHECVGYASQFELQNFKSGLIKYFLLYERNDKTGRFFKVEFDQNIILIQKVVDKK